MANDSQFHSNRLLAYVSPAELKQLAPSLKPVALKPKQVLYNLGTPLDYVYFPISGVISDMTVMEDGRAIEVATVGKEGMVGLTAFVGGESSPYEVMVQVPGDGFRMPIEIFRKEAERDRSFRRVLTLYNTAFAIQVSYSVACNGLHTVEQRCCRWLLMTQDRVGTSVIPLTHEFLAIMLGVRRVSVTDVLQPLQKLKLISNSRGSIEILDRDGLEHHACECYGTVNRKFVELFG